MSDQQQLRRSVMDLPLRQWNTHLDPSDAGVQAMIDNHDGGDDDDDDSSDDGSVNFSSVRPQSSNNSGGEPQRSAAAATLIYHESARDIVFRDHLRRAVKNKTSNGNQQPTGNDDMQSLYLSIRSLERRNSFDEGSTPHNIVQNSNGLERRNSFDEQQQQEQEHHSSMSIAVRDLRSSFRATASFDANSMRQSLLDDSSPTAATAPHTVGYIAAIRPLSRLILTPENHFHPLLKEQQQSTPASEMWTCAEQQVVEMLQNQRACVKTIKNTEWTAFLQRFQTTQSNPHGRNSNKLHDDIPPSSSYPFNSFVTSTTLLPPLGKKMRCYGSTNSYTTGVVFVLPTYFDYNESEEEAITRTETWSWPSGYSAKTEFNIDGRGRLINGRQEALCPLSVLRQYNHDYITKQEYMVGQRIVSGLNQIPYNEVFLRVGGLGRHVIANVADDNDAEKASNDFQRLRSFDRGVGLPVALFVRTATYGDLISMLRSRARMSSVLGQDYIADIPLLYITPEDGVRVFTSEMQQDMLDIASRRLNPFQNSTISYRTTIENTTEEALQQKVEELIDLDESIREALSPRELASLAGGFGATDESVATIMKQVMIFDLKASHRHQNNEKHGRPGRRSHSTSATAGKSHRLQDFVMEGLAAAVRAGDYYTARQLLILYSLVASHADELYEESAIAGDDSVSEDVSGSEIDSSSEHNSDPVRQEARSPRSANCTNPRKLASKKLSGLGRGADSLLEDLELVRKQFSRDELSSRTPAPPLNTDRLRAATNSFGLLTVLGAAQILKAIQDGSCKRRLKESISAVDEWVANGEKSMAFRIASWNDQRAAQGDLHIATDQNSKFMAFVGNKAISNRKAFAGQLRQVLTGVKFTSVETLQTINQILNKMHAPCLRLELLQYVLGLDSRYSVEHCKRSVELAATCLGMTHDDAQ